VTRRFHTLGPLVATLSVGLLLTFMACSDGEDPQGEVDGVPPSVDFTLRPGDLTTTFSAVATGGDSLFLEGLLYARITADPHLALGVSSGRQVQHVILTDTLGRMVSVLGRAGGGPGELRGISDVVELGERGTIAVWDTRASRLTEFGKSGDLVGAYTIPVPRDHQVLGMRDSLLVTTRHPQFGEQGEPRGYTLWGLSGDSVTTLQTTVERVNAHFELPVLRRSGRMGSWAGSVAPNCFPSTLSVMTGGRLVDVDTGAGAIDFVDLETGAREEVYRLDEHPVLERRTLDTLDAFLTDLSEFSLPGSSDPARPASDQKAARRMIDSLVAAMGSPGDPVPSVWSEILWDGVDRLWLQRAPCFNGTGPALWDVIGADGTRRVTVATDPELRLLAVRGGLMPLQFRDDLDVVHLGLARLPEGVS